MKTTLLLFLTILSALVHTIAGISMAIVHGFNSVNVFALGFFGLGALVSAWCAWSYSRAQPVS